MVTTSPSHSPSFWQQYMQEEVPLSQAMGLKVIEVAPIIRLMAPLTPNQNNKGTAFAGSLSSAMALGGWMCTQLWIDPEIKTYDVVLFQSEVTFDRPITGDFEIQAELSPVPDRTKVAQLLKRHNKARVSVLAKALHEGQPKAICKASYVILAK